ncbi:hypothetical protein M0R19_08025 [Candidatus Pacearchaeota archaeon]|nr:hypothetical protein [Candidatus Pacearchaeota archaeon]
MPGIIEDILKEKITELKELQAKCLDQEESEELQAEIEEIENELKQFKQDMGDPDLFGDDGDFLLDEMRRFSK